MTYMMLWTRQGRGGTRPCPVEGVRSIFLAATASLLLLNISLNDGAPVTDNFAKAIDVAG